MGYLAVYAGSKPLLTQQRHLDARGKDIICVVVVFGAVFDIVRRALEQG